MILLQDKCKVLKNSDIKSLKSIVLKTLESQNKSDSDVSVIIDTDETLRKLNLMYAGNDHATDVLSFSAGFIDPDSGKDYLGDIVISYDRAQEQADENHINIFAELQTLIVHGTLHLCGFDHADKVSEKKMFELQDKIINDFAGKPS